MKKEDEPARVALAGSKKGKRVVLGEGRG